METYYQLQISKDDDLSPTVLDEEVDDTIFTTSNLEASTTYYWRIRASNPGGYGEWSEVYSFTTVEATYLPDMVADNVSNLIVGQNYPNPFTDRTEIDFYISNHECIQFSIYDVLGRMVYIHTETYCPGNHSLQLDLGELKSGVYYFQFISGNDVVMKKMKKI